LWFSGTLIAFLTLSVYGDQQAAYSAALCRIHLVKLQHLGRLKISSKVINTSVWADSVIYFWSNSGQLTTYIISVH
jgi:hypothetical protein